MRLAFAALLVLAGCSAGSAPEKSGGAALEQAAITTGVIRDPAKTEIAGLYARDSDRVCIVAGNAKGGAGGYRIGATVEYGTENCSARGTITRNGDTLRVALDDAPGCTFNARMEGDRIVFPGQVPVGCDRLCTSRASLAALEADLLSDVPAEAAGMRDDKGRALCGS